VWQHTELTGTNKPCGLAIFYFTVALDLLLLGLLGTTNRIFSYPSFLYTAGTRQPKAAGTEKIMLFGGNSESETPVPIPNTEVKPLSADGTAREAWWESRSPPILFLPYNPSPQKEGFFLAKVRVWPIHALPVYFCSCGLAWLSVWLSLSANSSRLKGLTIAAVNPWAR
jgi:hypothetical protein